jgi:VanZ family protein
MALRAAAWLAVSLIIVVSLLPGSARPHSGLPALLEHFIAYAVAGWLMSINVRAAGTRWRGGILLVLVAIGCELLQQWIPDRNPQLIDVAASTAGTVFGIVAGLGWDS